jgi:hypothetical protein
MIAGTSGRTAPVRNIDHLFFRVGDDDHWRAIGQEHDDPTY